MSNTKVINNIDRIAKYGDIILQYPHYWVRNRSFSNVNY